MTKIIVQGTFDSSNNQLTFNLDNWDSLLNNQNHSVLLSQQPSNTQISIIRKPSPYFYTSTLGLAGGIGLLISCVWSVLLPAIGSVGIITFAYLVNRKITPLQAKELSSESAKTQSAFTQRLASGKDLGNLLDESVNTYNLPPPILPISNVANQPNIPPPPPPMPGPGNLVGKFLDSNIPIPIQLPSAPPMPPEEEESQKVDSTYINSRNPATSEESDSRASRNELLDAIRKGKKLSFTIEGAEKTIKENPEDYPSTLLLGELKTTYKRALDISKSKGLKDWEKYFTDKVEKFDDDFPIKKQIEEQTSESMKSFCEKAKGLDSILKNMQWVKSLLYVLSERKGLKDLSTKAQNHCSEKLKTIDKHIEKLQSQNGKKSKEATKNSKPAENELVKDLAGVLAIRAGAVRYSDSPDSGEESDNAGWDD